ncbi:hypothetical protein TCAL_07186 [Tigriopus californicus]|uniref:SMP-LTD domain-containing protein n=1 Tax=Tigriopus californicus TaxID=6832 RepID=A0A553PL35_TIGCA|nr:hypothetical protein TCAL_07186 [Tigriopus californicus]
MATEEEKALTANLLKDHTKEKAKAQFDKLTNIVQGSTAQVKKTTHDMAEKAEDLKEKTKKTILGRQEENDDSVPSQDEIHDPEEPGRTKKSNLPKPTKRQVVEFISYISVCILVYILGYMHYTFLLIFIPVLLYVIYVHQKVIKNEKALLFKAISEEGEEHALRARLKEFPSWFNFPDVERVEWINEMAKIFWPHISDYGDRILRLQVEPVAREALEKYRLWGFKFRQIQFGRMPPRITGVKVYNTNNREEVIMDLDVEYFGDADISISLMRIIASVGDVQVEGKLRIILKPLIGDVPIVGGIQMFFVKPPLINFDLGGVASVLDFPGLNSMLREAIQDQIAQRMLIPNKIAIVLTDKVSAEDDDDFLGQARINVSVIVKEHILDSWVTLDGVESGQVRLKLYWLPTSKNETDYRASKGSKHSRAILMFYLDSCTLRPIYGMNQAIKLKISVGPDEKESSTAIGTKYVFQQGFTFFLSEVDGEILHIKVMDAEDDDNVLVLYNFSVAQLQLEEQLGRKTQTYDFPDGNGWIKFAMRLKYLVTPSKSARDHFVMQRASNVAGVSKKFVEGAARNFGSRTSGLAKGVGSGTSSAVKSFGTATSGAMNFLKKSPRVPHKNGEALLETNLDEDNDTFDNDIPKGKLPSTYVADLGGSEPDLEHLDDTDKRQNENVRRRLSDNFRYFKK